MQKLGIVLESGARGADHLVELRWLRQSSKAKLPREIQKREHVSKELTMAADT